MLSGKFANIRPIEQKDFQIINQWRREPGGGAKFLGLVAASPSSGIREAFTKTWVKNFIIEDKDGIAVGIICLDSFRWQERCLTFLIDICNPKYLDTLASAESAKMMLSHIFFEQNFNRVISLVLDYEEGTQKLIESIGFVKEATLREQLFYNNSYRDVYIYGLLKDEFKI